MRIGFIAMGLIAAGLVVGAGFATTTITPAQQTASVPLSTGASGLPLPRFVSLKSDRVNARQGPSRTHAVRWVFARQGLPVEIIAEFNNWRQIRDSEGAEAWVFHSLLSGRRTGLVVPWSGGKTIALMSKADDNSDIVAKVEPGVLCTVEKCNGNWCQIAVGNTGGWIAQDSLWGVYPGEKL